MMAYTCVIYIYDNNDNDNAYYYYYYYYYIYIYIYIYIYYEPRPCNPMAGATLHPRFRAPKACIL